jgi:hypothetical protein
MKGREGKVETKLRRLFDAQKFFRSQRLERVIRQEDTRQLDDDELAFLFAAGEVQEDTDGNDDAD